MIIIFSASLAFAILLCILVGLLLLFYAPKTKKYNRLLAVFYFLIGYQCFITFLLSTQLMKTYPHFHRTGYIALLLSMPISYLYVRSVLTEKKISKTDIAHFIPAIVFIIDFLPFFLLPGPEKVLFYTSENVNKTLIMFKESQIFPPGFYTSFKYIQTSVYWILQVFLIYKIVRKNSSIFKGENSVWIKWLLVFILSESFLFLPPMALLNSQFFYNPWVVFFYVGGGTGLTAIFIFFFPRILYGLQDVELINSWDIFYKKNRKEDDILKRQSFALKTSENNVSNADSIVRDGVISKTDPQNTLLAQFISGKIYPIQSEKFSYVSIKEKQNPTYYLSKKRKMKILTAIRGHFSENKPYLILHYTQQQLAAELNIPTQYISTVINEFEKVNFNDFVNHYRVQHCIELLQNDEHRFHTLEYIATKCGFNNRNTFTIAFKKVVGQTPSAYIKSLSAKK